MTQPTFIMLMGLPGSGKSTWRSQFKGECVHLSTDDLIEEEAAIRGLTYSDVWERTIKPATSAVNAAFQAALKDGASIIWDQTNLTAKKRLGILRQIPKTYHKVCVVVSTTEEERQKRLRSRPGKVIPVPIDRQMQESMTQPTLDEGWNEIIKVNT